MDLKFKWNQRYRERLKDFQAQKPNERLVHCSKYFKGKRVLDLASGPGKNSLFLAEQGFHVTSVDISEVAIQFLQKEANHKNLAIEGKVIDLSNLEEVKQLGKFDIVIITYYLDRKLFHLMNELLENDGTIFIETYFYSENVKQEVPKKYALASQELLRIFQDFRILFFEELDEESRQTILCQKIF